MAQIFHRSANTIARVSIFGAVFFVAGLLGLVDAGQPLAVRDRRGRRARAAGPVQPRAPRRRRRHRLPLLPHVGRGLVVRRHPADQDVHELPLADLGRTARCSSRCATASATGKPIEWTRVHDLPDFVYFNHSIHVNKGVGCATCHGRVDQMPLMWQETVAADGVVPRLPPQPGAATCGRARQVFNMDYEPPADQAELGRAAGEGIPDRSSTAHQLLDVPPMNA